MRKILAVLLFALGCLVQSADAQVLYGSLVGTVADQSGAVVPQATLTLTNTATGQVRETTTDAEATSETNTTAQAGGS